MQYVSQYIVFNTNIASKHSILAFLLRFSVAVATHTISLASHSTRMNKPHSHRDVGPSRAGLTIARVIRECHRSAIEAQALLTFVQKRPFRL